MAQKERQPDWKETNMSLFGSDIEKKVKAAAADGEPQWDDAGLKVGMQVWRIEQFKVVKWKKFKMKEFCKLHRGDSYIMLNTFVKNPDINPDKLAWDVHFWIGSESTQDEYGTAAYKTVELDDKLGGEPVQHREVEGNESKLFLSYFPKLTYLEGGVESGFKKAADRVDEHEITMYQIKGKGTNVMMKQVSLTRSAMNSGDVFILDTEEVIYQWNGINANAAEKNQAAAVCQGIRNDRSGKPSITTLDEGSDGMDEGKGMWEHLPGERTFLGIKYADIKIRTEEGGGDDEKVEAYPWTLYKLKESGSVSRVSRGQRKKPPISKLKSDYAYLFDSGFEIFVWVGKKAPSSIRGSFSTFAQSYLKSYRRPPVLPIHLEKEGQETTNFNVFFGPAEEEACCACVIS